MCTNHDLETRIVILEAALDWVRHEAQTRKHDPMAMARIAAIATQVLEDDAITMTRRLAHARSSETTLTTTPMTTVEHEEAELRAG